MVEAISAVAGPPGASARPGAREAEREVAVLAMAGQGVAAGKGAVGCLARPEERLVWATLVVLEVLEVLAALLVPEGGVEGSTGAVEVWAELAMEETVAGPGRMATGVVALETGRKATAGVSRAELAADVGRAGGLGSRGTRCN